MSWDETIAPLGGPCANIREDLPAYALDALAEDERHTVETHLIRCSACRAALDRLASALTALGSAAPPIAPPPDLRERLLADARAASPLLGARTAAHLSIDHHGHRREGAVLSRPVARGLGLVTAVLLASLTVAVVLLDRTRDQRDEALARQHTVDAYLRDLGRYLSHGGTATPLTPVTPPATGGPAVGGSLYIASDQPGGMVVVYGLPPSGEERGYRVWVERGDERTTLAEIVVTDQGLGWLEVDAPEPLSTYETIGITMVTPTAPRDLLVATIEPNPSG